MGGGKGEPSPIKNLGGRMGDLDRTGDKNKWGPRKDENPPNNFEIGMGDGAHKGKDVIVEGDSSKYSSSAIGFKTLKFETESSGTYDGVITENENGEERNSNSRDKSSSLED